MKRTFVAAVTMVAQSALIGCTHPAAIAPPQQPSEVSCDVALSLINDTLVQHAGGGFYWVVDDPEVVAGTPNDVVVSVSPTTATGNNKLPRDAQPFADLLDGTTDPNEKVTACPNIRAYLDARHIPYGRAAHGRRGDRNDRTFIVMFAPIVSNDGRRAAAYIEVDIPLASHGGYVMLRRDGKTWRQVAHIWDVVS
jgi:hypothetical protein